MLETHSQAFLLTPIFTIYNLFILLTSFAPLLYTAEDELTLSILPVTVPHPQHHRTQRKPLSSHKDDVRMSDCRGQVSGNETVSLPSEVTRKNPNHLNTK